MRIMKSKKNKTVKLSKEGIFAISASIFLIFVALLNPLFSAGIAIGALVTAFIYKFSITKDKK